MSLQDKTVPAAELESLVARILVAAGSTEGEARTVAGNLVLANLSGHDSHGVGMVPRYVNAVLEGGLKPNTGVRVIMDAGSLLTLDGQRGYGQIVGEQAMRMGIERARAHGSCIMTLAQAHHLGRIGHFAEMAVDAGLVALHFVNVLSRPVVAPWGGGDGRFGTNPCCIAVPLGSHQGGLSAAGPPQGAKALSGGSEPHASGAAAPAGAAESVGATEPPPGRPKAASAPSGGSEPRAAGSVGAHFILDFATSRVAQGKMRVAYNKGQQVAPGYLIDAQGRPTTDPGVVVVPQTAPNTIDGSRPGGMLGALLTFGEHKGYGMAVACELLGGALTGNGTWHREADSAQAVINGMLTILIDPTRLGTQAQLAAESQAFVDWLRQSPPGQDSDGVLIAGEPERRARRERQLAGISIDAGTWAELSAAATKVGLAL